MKGLKLLLILIVIALIGCATASATTWDKIQSLHEEGWAFYQQGNYDAAIEKFKMAVDLDPSIAFYHHMLGVSYRGNKQFAEAIPHLKKAAELHPENIIYQTGPCYAYHDNQQYQEAIDCFKRSIELEPKNAIIISRLVLSYYNMGRYDDALSAVNEVISLLVKPSVGISVAIEGRFPVVDGLITRGAAEKADIKKGDKIVKVNRVSTKGWNQDKFSQSMGGPVGTEVVLRIAREGAKPFDKTITREIYTPKEAASSFGIRGSIYRAKGDSDQAMKDAEKAMGLEPDNPWARFSYGTACLDKGRYDDAAKALEGEIKIDFPVLNTQWLIAKATLYAKQGKTKELLDTCLEISEEAVSPKDVPVWNDRKVLLQTLKPLAQAHRENAKNFEAQGRFQEVLNELAGALGLAVDDKEAGELRNSIFQMVRRMPRPPEISKDARKYALRAEILIKEGDLKGAILEIKKAIRRAPFSAKLYFNTALIYGQLKNYPEAIRYMNIYLQAAPDAPNAPAANDEIIKWELLMEKGT